MNPDDIWNEAFRWSVSIGLPLLLYLLTARLDRNKRRKDEADTIASYADTIRTMSENYKAVNSSYTELCAAYAITNSRIIGLEQDRDRMTVEINLLKKDREIAQKENLVLNVKVTALIAGVEILDRQLRKAGIIPEWDLSKLN